MAEKDASEGTDRPDRQARIRAAAERALAEAAERRKAAEAQAAPKEIDGRGGPEPSRYGDWEVKGRASDF